MPKALRSAITYFRATSFITGTFLLLLVLEMVVRYGFGYDFYAFGPNGLVSIEQRAVTGEAVALSSGFNLSTGVLIVHGWLYVAYLFGAFRMWTLFQWSFFRFLIIAAGGIVPTLSFFTERYYQKVALAQIGENTL